MGKINQMLYCLNNLRIFNTTLWVERKNLRQKKNFSSDPENKSAVEVKIKTKIFEFLLHIIKDTRQWLKRLIICICNHREKF